MSRITIAEAQAYAEPTKLPVANLDSALEGSIAVQVLARVAQAYDTSSWTDATTTPAIVRTVIAMKYVSTLISRSYAEDADESPYALRLDRMANDLITGIIDGSIDVVEETTTTTIGAPAFYPNDESSALDPTSDDRSLGHEAFTMGVIW